MFTLAGKLMGFYLFIIIAYVSPDLSFLCKNQMAVVVVIVW